MGYNGVTVLVVEDEALLRMDISQSLEDKGFKVLEASNADEAVRILDARNDVHLLFTDVDMPGSMDGLKLAAAVRDRWPPIKIIVTSGYRQMSDDSLPIEGRFIPKPYNPSRVMNAMQELMASA